MRSKQLVLSRILLRKTSSFKGKYRHRYFDNNTDTDPSRRYKLSKELSVIQKFGPRVTTWGSDKSLKQRTLVIYSSPNKWQTTRSFSTLFIRELHTSTTCLIKPPVDCPKPKPKSPPICGIMPPPPKPKCEEVPCPKSGMELKNRVKCQKMCIVPCKPPRKDLDCWNPVWRKYVKVVPSLASYSECRCGPEPVQFLCAECFPKLPSCPKHKRETIFCKTRNHVRKLRCLPREKPKQKPWNEIERCIQPPRCSEPDRIDDRQPPKVYKPLPPIFPYLQQTKCFHTSTRFAVQISPPLSGDKFSCYKVPCIRIYPGTCYNARTNPETEQAIIEMRLKLEGKCRECGPPVGCCPKKPFVMLGNLSSYIGHKQPWKPYCTYTHKYPQYPPALEPYTHKMRCRRHCAIVKEEVDKMRKKTEQSFPKIIPTICQLAESDKPPEFVVKSKQKRVRKQCTVPYIKSRPIMKKPFPERNCTDVRNQTEGVYVPRKCRLPSKLCECDPVFRIFCEPPMCIWDCTKTDCPYPSYADCKEPEWRHDVDECVDCQQSITPMKDYSRLPCGRCRAKPCPRTWSRHCLDRPKDDRHHLITFTTFEWPHNKRRYSTRSNRSDEDFPPLTPKFVTAPRFNVEIEEDCYNLKCKILTQEPPKTGTVECPVTPECNNEENRAKFCIDKYHRRDTWGCDEPPESTGGVCACIPDIKCKEDAVKGKKKFSTWTADKKSPLFLIMRQLYTASYFNNKYVTDPRNRLLYPRKMDPHWEYCCYQRKCKALKMQPDVGNSLCPKTAECDTPENRKKYCKPVIHKTIRCRQKFKPTKATCVVTFITKDKIQRSHYSTAASNTILIPTLQRFKYIGQTNILKGGNKGIIHAFFDSMKRFKHTNLLCTKDYLRQMEQVRNSSNVIIETCLQIRLPKGMECPAPIPLPVSPRDCEDPKSYHCYVDPCDKSICHREEETETQKSGYCDKICLKGCRSPYDRLFCVDDPKLDIEYIHKPAPYPAFTDMKRMVYARLKINECLCIDDYLYKKRIYRKFKPIQNPGPVSSYSTYTRALAVQPSTNQVRQFSTRAFVNNQIRKQACPPPCIPICSRKNLGPTCKPMSKYSIMVAQIVDNIINYFKARPNCPHPDEYRKRKLIKKAKIAAKKAGLLLCDIQVKADNPCKKECPKAQDPESLCKKPKETKCKDKNCPRHKTAGCRAPCDRPFCMVDPIEPSFTCEPAPTPYPSFTEAGRFEYKRHRINECTLLADRLFRQRLERKGWPKEMCDTTDKKFSTLASCSAVPYLPDPLKIQKRAFHTSLMDNRKNDSKSKQHKDPKDYPYEMGEECVGIPFTPSCDELPPPSPKKPCKIPCPPPPPPPPCIYPCPQKPPKVEKPRPMNPPRPPECLIDHCKRYRECCRQPPKPPVFPCDDDC